MTTTTKAKKVFAPSPMKEKAMEALKEVRRLKALDTWEVQKIISIANPTTEKVYSLTNCFILAQQAAFEGKGLDLDYAGFHQWKGAGRKVKKGAKAYYVYSPIIKKEQDSEGKDYTAIKGCFFQAVFAKSDTETL